jgi:hypothetical protein
MITVKNRRLDTDAISILNELIELDISAVAAFKLAKIVKELDNIVTIKNEREVALIKKYAKTEEDGSIVEGKNAAGEVVPNTFEIKEGEGDEFNKEMEELLSFENEITFEQLSIEELNLDKFSAKKIMKIDFLFEM